MIDLKNELASFSIEDQREVAYFLVRYFKGFPHLEEEGKDIFEDVFEEPVAPSIKEAAERIIRMIELEFGSATQYDEATAVCVLNAITQFEESITEQPTQSQISGADTFFQETKLSPF